MDAPCYKCEKRTVNCHAHCEAYKKYDGENKKRRRQRVVDMFAKGDDRHAPHKSDKSRR